MTDTAQATSSTSSASVTRAELIRTLSSSEYTPSPNKSDGQDLVRQTTADTVTRSDVGLLDHDEREQHDSRTYHVYKRRFFGLAQLVLLNIVIAWDWLTFAAISSTAAEFFHVSETAINWLSTGFLFAFVAAAPFTIWVLNHYGPKTSIVVASVLTLVGNWVRYAGTRAGNGYFGVVMFGQILIGFAQPFVLAAPTRYSNLWFSDTGRITATAVASLANPFGGALGQLIGPLWVGDPAQLSLVPNMVLYTAVISSVAALPVPLLPAKPPSPPSATAALETLDLREAFREVPRNGSFMLLLVPFSIFVGFFNATSSLVNQILEPYGFSETDAGIAGGLLIIVGLIASAIVSPIIDRNKQYLITIKILVPCIAICYIVLIFMPGTRNVAGPYVVCAVLGATSFSLLPVALELLSIVTLPVSPEVSSVIAWSGGQILGAIFIIIMDALEAYNGWNSEPRGTMIKGLIFQALVACLAVPFPLFLGTGKFRSIVVES